MNVFKGHSIFAVIASVTIGGAASAQEIGILSEDRQIIERDERVFERIDDMLLEYQGIGPKSVQPVGVRTWPDGILPIAFENGYSQADQDAFFEACNWWSAVSRVACIPRTNQADFIDVVAGSGNSSYVGRIKGGQKLELFNRQNRGVIAHEIAHALGFAHQHNSPERNRFIDIKWNNIAPADQHNFRRIPQAIIFGFYDFCSIMHYGLNDFSSNGQPTIELIGNPPVNCTPGQVEKITIEDAMGMAAAYGRDAEDRLFVEVPDFTSYSGSFLTNPNWPFSRFGVRATIMAGENRDQCVIHTPCERTCYMTKVSTQNPTAGSLVEFGTNVSLTTFVDAKYIFYPPPGKICP